MDLTQVSDKPIMGTGWACDDKVAGNIVEQKADSRVIRKIFICIENVRLKVFEE